MPAQPMPDGRVPVILSAHDERLIRQDAAAILDYLTRLGNDSDPTPDVAATVLRLRRLRRHRAVVRAGGRDELVSALSAVAQGAEHPLVARSSAGAAACPAFVFPGQGSQLRAMGADAYRGLAAYRAEADRCAAAFARAGWPSPLPYLIGDDDREWSRTEIQGAQFVHAAGLAAQWKSHGILPGVTVGHSLGEVAAAYVAEKISLGDAVALVGARATAVDRLTGQFAMVVLGLDVDAARALIAEVPGWLEVSAVNGPSATVVSGNHDPVIALAELAGRRDVFAHKLVVDYPGHTSALRPLTTSLAAQLPDSRFRDTPVAFVSSAVGDEVAASTDFGRYWIESLCTTVRFDRAVVAAQQCGANAFIEMSAHPTLLYPLTDITEDAAVIMGSGHRDHAIVDVLSANIAAAAAADPHFQWTDLIPAGPNRPLRGFPNAPMRSQHLWVTSQPAAAHQVLRSVPVTVALETWRRAEDFHHNGTVPTGIAVVGAGHLSGALAEAAANHHHCRVVPVDEADIVAVVAPTFEERGFVGALTALASRADAGLPDYDALIGPRCRTVWLVTAGAEHVLDDDVVARPAHSALAAMHRSVGFEFADQNFGNLDLPADALDSGAAAAAVEALLGVPGVTAVRSQNGRAGRYVRALVESAEPAAVRSPDTSVLRTVVITGGSGAIGLRYARHCVERGAQTVILLSRNGVDARLLAELSAGHQVEIHAPRCDITDRSAVAATAARYGATGATLLIHTAGIAQAAAHADLTGADVAAVCAAKVYGLAAMAQEWPQQPGCRIVACSSVFGVWGGHGHAAYAASNRLLDVLVAQLRAGGADCTSIRWGLWQDAGVVEAAEIARTERSGLVAMDPDRAIAVGFGRYCGDPLVFDADFDRLRVFLDSQAIPATLASLSDDTSDGPLGDVGTRPLAEVVHAELSATLQLGSGEPIDATASLIDLGLDSLLALDLRRRLRRAVGRSAPVARMLGGITVSELIDVLDAGPALDRDPGKVGIHA